MVLLNNARKSILVTGATGYIGSHTVLELLNAGFRVIAIANSNPGNYAFMTKKSID
jgi:UDP-glucose 4-epimerase